MIILLNQFFPQQFQNGDENELARKSNGKSISGQKIASVNTLKRVRELAELNGNQWDWNILREEKKCLNEKGQADYVNLCAPREGIWIII